MNRVARTPRSRVAGNGTDDLKVLCTYIISRKKGYESLRGEKIMKNPGLKTFWEDGGGGE